MSLLVKEVIPQQERIKERRFAAAGGRDNIILVGNIEHDTNRVASFSGWKFKKRCSTIYLYLMHKYTNIICYSHRYKYKYIFVCSLFLITMHGKM